MKNLKIGPFDRFCGKITPPPSKSVAHRALICASLAAYGESAGESIINNLISSDDISATIHALKNMGANVDFSGDVAKIKRVDSFPESCTVDCIESASTLRFLIPFAAALGNKNSKTTFIGRGRLPKRTIALYKELLSSHGASIEFFDEASGIFLPAVVGGRLCGGRYEIRGDISSQFITGLLLVLPLLNEDSDIILTTPLQSKPYIDLTISIQKEFGVMITETENGYHIKGNQRYLPKSLKVEGDYSQAAFFACGAAIMGEVTLSNLISDSLQGDKAVFDILEKMGAKVERMSDTVTVKKGALKGVTVDCRDIPDIVPVLSVAAAAASGKTVFYNIERLRIKESDRVKSVVEMLENIGAKVAAYEDRLEIEGVDSFGSKPYEGGFVCSYCDHRIAMSAAIASLICKNGVTVDDFSCISKSYPHFLDDFYSLAGDNKFTGEK